MIFIYYGKDLQKKEIIRQGMKALKLDYIELGEKRLLQTMGSLVNLKKSDLDLMGEYPLFLYAVGETTETILNLEKEIGFTIPRKAKSNENNRKWKLIDLMKEIDEEAVYFEKREYLYDLIKKADSHRMETDIEYAKLMSAAYSLIEEGDAPISILEIAIEMVENQSKLP